MSEFSPANKPSAEEAEKLRYSLEEIAKHNTVESPWLAINGKIYDVSQFIDHHPGGEEVMIEHAGTDATVAFDDVGHSDQAIELLEEMLVGVGNPDELKIIPKKKSAIPDNSSDSSNTIYIVICIIVALAAYYYFKALKD